MPCMLCHSELTPRSWLTHSTVHCITASFDVDAERAPGCVLPRSSCFDPQSRFRSAVVGPARESKVPGENGSRYASTGWTLPPRLEHTMHTGWTTRWQMAAMWRQRVLSTSGFAPIRSAGPQQCMVTGCAAVLAARCRRTASLSLGTWAVSGGGVSCRRRRLRRATRVRCWPAWPARVPSRPYAVTICRQRTTRPGAAGRPSSPRRAGSARAVTADAWRTGVPALRTDAPLCLPLAAKLQAS